MKTVEDSTLDTSMQVCIADEGASLSVTFSLKRYPTLFGFDAYDNDPPEPRWAYVENPDRARFTERSGGRYAPYSRVHVREEYDYNASQGERTVKVRFDSGSPYGKRLTVKT